MVKDLKEVWSSRVNLVEGFDGDITNYRQLVILENQKWSKRKDWGRPLDWSWRRVQIVIRVSRRLTSHRCIFHLGCPTSKTGWSRLNKMEGSGSPRPNRL
jgi:hypothetical protein